MLDNRRVTSSITFAGTHLYTLVKRGTVREHSVGARTATVRDMAGQRGIYTDLRILAIYKPDLQAFLVSSWRGL